MRPVLDIIYDFRWVREGEVARASQAHFGGLEGLMRRHALRAIINLRGENSDLSWWRSERAVCERLGAAHFDAMLDSRKLPTTAMMRRLFAAFDEAPKPFLLKCSGGQDRTGFAAALYLIDRHGWDVRAEALGQFSGRAKKHQRWMTHFIDYAGEQKGALAAWIQNGYAPEDFAEWLTARGFGDSFEAIFTKPTRSPFQL